MAQEMNRVPSRNCKRIARLDMNFSRKIVDNGHVFRKRVDAFGY